MSRHHRCRRLAALAACVGSTAALAALGGAAPALAVESVTCATPGFASGSSLQNSAQTETWLTSTGWGGSAIEATEKTACTVKPFSSPTAPKITYTKTSSGQGLEEFGNGTGVLQPEEDKKAEEAEKKGEGIKDTEGNVLDFFVGTDDPPNSSEMGEAQTAAGAKHGSVEITIPVAQSPVTVMLSLPAGCTIEPGSHVDLNNNSIGQLWEGLNAPKTGDPGGIQAQGGYAAGTWGAFLAQLGYAKIAKESEFVEGKKQFVDVPGTEEELAREKENGKKEIEQEKVKEAAPGCAQQINPQARFTESGTSFAYKKYLSQINKKEWGQYADDFTNWPSSLVKLEEPKTAGVGEFLNESGGNLAEDTAATPGSVGYAAASDAQLKGTFNDKATVTQFGTGEVEPEAGKKEKAKSLKHEILWAQIQDDGTGAEPEESGYVDPLLPGESKAANCETSVLVPGDQDFPYSYNDTWAGVTSTDPNIKGDAKVSDYPICALTYDLVWHHYKNAHLYGNTVLAEEVAHTTHNLLEYITTQGQLDIQGHYYQRFPSAMAAHVAIGVNEIKP
jgi:hypothetical protein